MSHEQRERLLIAEQTERAREQEEPQGSRSESFEEPGLKRDEGAEKAVLCLALKWINTRSYSRWVDVN